MGIADWNRLEPEVTKRLNEIREIYGDVTEKKGRSALLHSIAVSLKRIADVLEIREKTGIDTPEKST